MSNLKPMTLYSHHTGPNPWKVAIILEELDLPYQTKMLEFPELKKEPFESLNPNGRVPVLEDPNTGITLFESGAILEYLVDMYDKDNKISYASGKDKYLSLSWLHFQVSGQGPYYGQKAWFSNFHSEKNITSAIDRYANEIKRVISVIDRHLAKQGTAYLVGSKCTYADLSFVPWHQMLGFLMGPDFDPSKEAPYFARWNKTLMERDSVKKIAEEKKKAAHH
ncbi:glutathione S-transferase [Saccharata proteae CBS 121410]|uniref:Glutathione S-transferase n=1 Tax=Saccharata proteae CBS 121410 TaxID=1314787 RepID=A0A9P4HNT5_9PEZI|nr:glutathione S-transferase [Saccharata proteae CBS 121410]